MYSSGGMIAHSPRIVHTGQVRAFLWTNLPGMHDFSPRRLIPWTERKQKAGHDAIDEGGGATVLNENGARASAPWAVNEGSLKIRPATLEDAPGILAIYQPFIEHTSITFEYTVPSLDEFRARMASTIGIYPYLVAEQTQQPSEPEEPAKARIIGYAYAHRMGERAAFQWNAELAVYLAPEAQGQGLGERLVRQLESELSAMGVRNLFSLITADNEPSLRLHEKLGFAQVGYHPNAGYKLGRWHDLVYLRKPIGSFEGEPQPLAQ